MKCPKCGNGDGNSYTSQGTILNCSRCNASWPVAAKTLRECLDDMDKAGIIAFVSWCQGRNMKVSTVSHCLWARDNRQK